MSKDETDQDVYDGTRVIGSLEELKALFEVETDEDIADFVWNALGPEDDLGVDYDGDTLILVLGTIGTALEFPMTLDHFWEQMESTLADPDERV